MNKLIDGVLWLLLALGFFGAVKVSYANFTGDLCPAIWVMPICYIVLVAYALMIAALLVGSNRFKTYFFCAGWSTAFLFAAVGSAAEMFAGGGVCPVSGGGSLRGGAASSGSIPMCYISLALTIGILVLFLAGPYRRACKIYNAKATN